LLDKHYIYCNFGSGVGETGGSVGGSSVTHLVIWLMIVSLASVIEFGSLSSIDNRSADFAATET